jgi:plasmid stabilization system protein ParE
MVRFSRRAHDHLHDIHDHIKLDSPFYAKKVVRDIVRRCKAIPPFPMAGRMVPELQNPNIREVFEYSYRLIYEIVADNEINILAIVHFSRNFKGF